MASAFSSRVSEVVQLEYAVLIFIGSLAAWLFYKTALRKVSAKRHVNLKTKFWNLGKHLIFFFSFGACYFGLSSLNEPSIVVQRALPYLGLLTLFSGTMALLKLTRIAVLEFLFLGHMKEGVPLLIVNIFTLVLAIGLFVWYSSTIFGIQLGPLLATSAVFSIVLGLALQDTISNLFAGLGLQFDESFQIGDWIEVIAQNQKWAGQVTEISWRSTVLVSLSDEIIVIPNRTISQAMIHNYANRPFLRNQLIKVDYNVPQDTLRLLVVEAAKTVPGILQEPFPVVLFWDLHESYAVYKLVYSINDFGAQYLIADKLISKIAEILEANKIKIAQSKLELKNAP